MPTQQVSGLLLAPADARACYVLAHGAGAGMTHPFMAAVAEGLAERGIATLRYQFPYMERGSQAARRAAARARDGARRGGGGRAAAARTAAVRRRQVVRRPHDLAGAGRVAAAGRARPRVPRLPAASGRQAVGRARRAPVATSRCRCCSCRARATNSPSWSCCSRWSSASVRARRCACSSDADHSFHVPARSGRKDAQVMAEMLDVLAKWLRSLVRAESLADPGVLRHAPEPADTARRLTWVMSTCQAGASRSDKPTRCSISARSRSVTVKPTSAPSAAGSTCTRNGRLPAGIATASTIASATSEASASAGTISAKACCTCAPNPAYGPGVVLGRACLVGRLAAVGEVVGATGERARDDDRGLDAPPRQLACVLHRNGIHRGLGAEVGRQVRRRAAGDAAAGHPDHQAAVRWWRKWGRAARLTRCVLSDVDVVQLRVLFRR